MRKSSLFASIIFTTLAFAACTDRSSNPSKSQATGTVRQLPGCVSRELASTLVAEPCFSYEFTEGLMIDFCLADNCTSDSIRFVASYQINNDTIAIVAVDTATLNARCPCDYLVHAEIEGLTLDRYLVLCTRIDNGVKSIAYSRYVYRNGGADPGEEVIYSNSFESAADTVGWTGYGSRQFRNDAAPGGGHQSLFVSGGCIVPHAAFSLGKMNRDGRFIIRYWGRNLGMGGGVGLNLSQSPFGGIGAGLGIQDTLWTLRESNDTLDCPADSSLWITMVSGGIVPSAMLVDRLEVIRVE